MIPFVCIILVNYRGLADTVECIESLEKVKYENYKIIVVDNASEDGSYETLRTRYPMHAVLHSDKNLGFSAGNNIGIRYALEHGADYVVLLNNDTTAEEDLITQLLSCFEKNKDAGLVGGKILYYDNPRVISHAGGYIDLFKFTTVHYGMDCSTDDSEYNISREIGFVSGCLMMISREVLEKVGLLDESFFMYYEDTDYCMRVVKAGYKLFYAPAAVILHKISKSSGGEESPFFLEWNTRNRFVFMNRYKNSNNSLVYGLSKLYFYSTRLFRITKYNIEGQNAKAMAIARGLRMGIECVKKQRFAR